MKTLNPILLTLFTTLFTASVNADSCSPQGNKSRYVCKKIAEQEYQSCLSEAQTIIEQSKPVTPDTHYHYIYGVEMKNSGCKEQYTSRTQGCKDCKYN